MTPVKKDDIVLMAHGGGGRMTAKLIREVIVSALGNPILNTLDDSACLEIEEKNLVMTTDSFVIDPVFFPGGDIGRLAACGTINDLAMQGAEPRYLSLGLILNEGLPLSDLETIIHSLKAVCDETGCKVVTGDTKVVETGGLFINTTGIGVRRQGVDVSVSNARPGDSVIITGTIGDHGMAVMNEREGLGIKSGLKSDVAPLWGLVEKLLEQVPKVHCLRDPTRGGVAAALSDIAEKSGCSIHLEEASLPVRAEVRGACDILGMDPLNAPNEGKALIVCAAKDRNRALETLLAHPLGSHACAIGEVSRRKPGLVTLRTKLGGERVVDVPVGEELPRIC